METESQTRARALSHVEYLQTLHRPSVAEVYRISDIQREREIEIQQKYLSLESREAATRIQRAYRGHRIRRQLNGLTLDPSERWLLLIKELKFRSAAASQYGSGSPRIGIDGRPQTPSAFAKSNWQRVMPIAEHAGAGESPSPGKERRSFLSEPNGNTSDCPDEDAYSMMMDTRYFLEMVDQKHRYGANLLAYHEQWVRSQTDQNFFYWLDRGEGRQLSLSVCSREKLEKERIRYLSRDERRDYLVCVDSNGKLRWEKNGELITTSSEQYKDSMVGIIPRGESAIPSFGDERTQREQDESRRLIRRAVRNRSGSSPWPSDVSDDSNSDTSDTGSSPDLKSKAKKKARRRIRVTPAAILNQLLRASVKPGTWIYVMDTAGRLYAGIKSSGAFQHASFLSGGRISSAGTIGIESGQLVYLSPLSGHYRPTTKSFKLFIKNLRAQGVDMSQLHVSEAFKILVTMEYYRKFGKVGKHKKVAKDRLTKIPRSHSNQDGEIDLMSASSGLSMMSATSEVDLNWDREHRRGLAKLMGDLHIRSRSVESNSLS